MSFTEFTLKKKAKFISELSKWPNVSRAARLAGVSRVTAYNHRRTDPDFKQQWEEALQDGLARLEEEAERRAFKGVLEPVYYQGQKVGAVRKFSDTLAIFLLKAHDPDKYRDRRTVELRGSEEAPIVIMYDNHYGDQSDNDNPTIPPPATA